MKSTTFVPTTATKASATTSLHLTGSAVTTMATATTKSVCHATTTAMAAATKSLDLTGSAVLGKSLTQSLTNALPSAPAYLAVGLQQRPTPFDLGLAGAPGCRLYISNEVILVVTANTSGAYSSQFNVPSSSSLVCTRIYVQMLPFDKQANPFGATATNYGRVMLGN